MSAHCFCAMTISSRPATGRARLPPYCGHSRRRPSTCRSPIQSRKRQGRWQRPERRRQAPAWGSGRLLESPSTCINGIALEDVRNESLPHPPLSRCHQRTSSSARTILKMWNVGRQGTRRLRTVYANNGIFRGGGQGSTAGLAQSGLTDDTCQSFKDVSREPGVATEDFLQASEGLVKLFGAWQCLSICLRS
jgi:hypothetical protein